MWEYKFKEIKYKSTIDLMIELNALGERDWEVINFTDDKYENSRIAKILFKRKKIVKNENN